MASRRHRRQRRIRPDPGAVRAVLDGYAALAGALAPVVDATCQLPDGGAVVVDPSPRRKDPDPGPPVFEDSPALPERTSSVISSPWLG